MSKRLFKAGATDQTIDVFIQNTTSVTGAGLTGLAFNTSGLTCYYRKGATGTPTALTLATQTVGGAHSDGGFVAVDGTNMPGVYRLDLSDTILATAGWATIYLQGAANMAPVVAELEIVSYDPFDAVRLGLTALPNVASGNAGAIITAGTGTAQLSTSSGQVLVQSGTGSGQLSVSSGIASVNVTQFGGSNGTFASGRPDINLTHIAGSAVSTTTAQLGVNIVQISGDATSADNLESYTDGTTPIPANVTQILGAGVSASTAQLGVNVVNFGGTAGTFSSGRPEVNTTHAAGTAWGSGAITAASIATGAIDADAIAADAVTEINAAVVTHLTDIKGSGWDSGTDTLEDIYAQAEAAALAIGTANTRLGSFSGVDSDTVHGRLPAALTAAGNMKVDVLAISGDATAADNLESYTDGTTPIPANVTQISGDATAADDLEAALDGTGSVTITADITGDITGNLSGSVGSVTSAVTANVTQISGDSTAADNAEAFFDGTGYAGTNNVIPLVTTTTTVTNAVSANVTQISGDTTAADNAEAFFDGTGYAGTNNVIPTVTDVSNMVSANVTQISGDSVAADNLEAALDGTGYNVGGGSVVAASVTGAVGSVTGNVGGNVAGSVASVTAGVTLANAAITSAKYDASTAFPLAQADSGSTAVARTGADSDTLKSLSDQIDDTATQTSVDTIDANVDSILADTGTDGVIVASFTTAAKAEIQTEANDAIVANNLDHLAGTATASADMTTECVDNSILSRILANGDTSAFTPSTDGLQPIRDRGDAAWTTATGFSTIDASDIRDAIGLASANLDTQLADLPTVAEFEARTIVAASYATATNLATVDTVVDAIKAKTDSLTFTVSGLIDANVLRLGGDAQSLTDLKDFADAGYDPSTNKVQGVVLVDTVTTLTGHTAQTGDSYAIVSSGTHGNSAIKTVLDTVASNVVLVLADTGTDGVVLSATTCNKIADHVLRRDMENVEDSSNGDTLSLESLYGAIQAGQEFVISGTTMTVYQTDGTTELGTKTVGKTEGDDPIRSVQ